MKKAYLLSSIFILALFFSNITYVRASSTSTNKINAIKQKIIDIKQQAVEEKGKAAAEIASTTTNLKNAKQELKSAVEIKIGKKLTSQKLEVANGFEDAIKSLQDLVPRIESRIAKMASSGIDATQAKTNLDAIKIKINSAETETTNLENALAEQIPATGTNSTQIKQRNSILKNIEVQSEKTKTAISKARKMIIDALNSLEFGMGKIKTSTSTIEATSTNN